MQKRRCNLGRCTERPLHGPAKPDGRFKPSGLRLCRLDDCYSSPQTLGKRGGLSMAGVAVASLPIYERADGGCQKERQCHPQSKTCKKRHQGFSFPTNHIIGYKYGATRVKIASIVDKSFCMNVF